MDAPSLAVSRDGEAAVAWMDRRDGTGRVWLRRTGDEADRRLSLEGGAHPQVALDASGDVACVWEEVGDEGARVGCLRPGDDEPVLFEERGAAFPVLALGGGLLAIAYEVQGDVVLRELRVE